LLLQVNFNCLHSETKRQTAYLSQTGGDRPPPTLGAASASEDESDGEGGGGYSDDGGYDSDGDGGGGGASEADDAQWAAIDAFARRKAQAATKGGTGRFSRIEEEVSSRGAAQVIVLWVFEGAGWWSGFGRVCVRDPRLLLCIFFVLLRTN
jgi:hypothetical protein